MREFATGAAKRVALEILGWTVLAVGVLAIFLPGPGLLLTFGGLAILSTQYTWARRLTQPVKIKAMRGAAEGVETRLRIAVSALIALGMMTFGIYWLTDPPAPRWWPLDDDWWLFGGPAVGWTVVVSSLIGLVLLAYAVRRWHHRPDAVEAIHRMEVAHRAKVAARRKARRRLAALQDR